MIKVLLACVCAWAALVLAGCATTTAASNAESQGPVVPLAFRGDTGQSATIDEIADLAARAPALLLGENHGHPLGLSTAADLFDRVLTKAPAASLALEFIERDSQPALDDYLAGLIDESTFRTITRRTDSNYPQGHRAMVERAKAAGRPVLAANAPRVYVRLARTQGYERLATLTPEQRRLFRVPPQLASGKYRGDFEKVMNSMNPDAKPSAERTARIDAMFRSQQVWDWTMGESVARLVAAGATPAVLVVGRFHIDHRGGTVQAFEQLSPGARALTVTFVDAWSDRLRDEDRGLADFVVYVGPSPAQS
jgi:uncharacterized iron-regulated protein